MSSMKSALLVLLATALALIGVSISFAQDPAIAPLASPAASPLPPPATTGRIPLQAVPIGPQSPPPAIVPPSATNRFEDNDSVGSLPSLLLHQWSTTREVPPESLIS